jgi:SAM-dependent methyltransferase
LGTLDKTKRNAAVCALPQAHVNRIQPMPHKNARSFSSLELCEFNASKLSADDLAAAEDSNAHYSPHFRVRFVVIIPHDGAVRRVKENPRVYRLNMSVAEKLVVILPMTEPKRGQRPAFHTIMAPRALLSAAPNRDSPTESISAGTPAGLVFIRGDAENLPFAPSTFDGVVNVEAPHCYPNFPRFLAEVARVLRPGGHFLYADFRFGDRLAQWEKALVAAPLQMLRNQNINAEVLRGMNQNSSRSLDLVERRLPRFLHSLGRDFAGTKGSRIYKALHSGELSYRSYCFEKPLISLAQP